MYLSRTAPINPYPDRGSTHIWVQRLPIICHRFRVDSHLDRPTNSVPVLPVQPTDEVLDRALVDLASLTQSDHPVGGLLVCAGGTRPPAGRMVAAADGAQRGRRRGQARSAASTASFWTGRRF
jgi:hypothetical protein